MVTERENRRMITESILTRDVIGAALGGKEGNQALRNTHARMNFKTVPHAPVEGRHEGSVNGKP